MSISSRTPEGLPHRCPICGLTAAVEPSSPGGDSCCPSCGELLWQFRDCVAESLRIDRDSLALDASLAELGADSLDLVELVMALEEEFDVHFPDDAAARIQTVDDAIRYIWETRRFRNDEERGSDT